MLSLDSFEWSRLTHAYGSASDIPRLLSQLETLPSSIGNAEPWFSLWSALAHQGDVYPASFAAVPHVIEALSRDPSRTPYVFFQFPAWIEICRQRANLEVPEDVAPDYFASLLRLPALISAASTGNWDADLLASAMACLAISKGFASMAEVAFELNTENAPRIAAFLEGV